MGDRTLNNKKNGTAAIVPKVPGAFGAKPLPKPSASKWVGLTKLNLT
jgi:hypothetical protein